MPKPTPTPHDPTPPRRTPAPDSRRPAAEASTDPANRAELPTEAYVASSAASASLVGTCFGDFEILAELGRGGMGVVYKARQNSLDRLVAVKLLRGQSSDNPMVVARFQSEARAAAALSHPNIVNVYQVGDCPLGPYFVMEHIDGGSLETLLQKGPVPIAAAVNLLIVVTEAVHYAHSKGIIHRDLKPGNIMIDALRRPVVMDFGIAKFVGKSSGLTQEGAILGTPAYMPPEQAGEELAQVGPHSDVYALGAILYTLLTAKAPYEAETKLRTVLKVIGPEMPPPVRSLRPEVPAALERICMKCLNKRPADRFPTARALADELRRFRTAAASRSGPSTQKAAALSLLLIAPGKQIRLFQGTTIIGRAADCDLVLRDDEVSKHHCQIVLGPGEVVVEDLGSTNGTIVNGETVERAVLHEGDRLSIAGHTFEVRLSRSKE
jgi:serine/threonine protein kinase